MERQIYQTFRLKKKKKNITSIGSPNVVPLLALLAQHADFQSIAADGQVAARYGDLLVAAQVAVQMQVYLILIDRAVQLRIEHHRRWAYVILPGIVVVALIIRRWIVIVRAKRHRCGGWWLRPRAVVIAGARATAGTCHAAVAEHLRLGLLVARRHQRQRRG